MTGSDESYLSRGGIQAPRVQEGMCSFKGLLLPLTEAVWDAFINLTLIAPSWKHSNIL